MGEPQDMGLTRFDTLALDEQSRPCNGVTEPSNCGVRVAVYANWLNLQDPSSWRAGSLTARPVVVSLHHGDVTFLDIGVIACRGPRDGIYFATWFADYYAGNQVVAMAGLSLDGWAGGVYLGVTAADVEFLAAKLAEWASQKRIPPALGALTFAQAVRFNQGEDYVARGMGVPCPATLVGQAEEPTPAAWATAPKKET